MMTSSFDDRGLREYEYRVFSNLHVLQRDIQHAGLVTESVNLETEIQAMPKPSTEIPRSDAYNDLAKRLNRYAVNPNLGGTAAVATWDKLNKDILTYFTSGLPIYADPTSPLTAKGFSLDTRKRQLHYFDGTKNEMLCEFTTAKEWVSIQTLFPSLFNPSYAVGVGLLSNSVTVQPEKYVQLIHQVLNLNPNAKFDRFIEPAFIPLFANLKQHAAIRAQLAKHPDTRTQEELVADIVKGMYGKISAYLGREGTNPAMREVMISIIQYLDSGDYDHLANAMQTYDSAWLIKASNWLFSNEVDNTLNMIKEMRKSAFLDSALKKMVEQQYGTQKEYSDADIHPAEDVSEISSVHEFEEDRGYEFESHIVDFESSEDEVNEMWETCRVTKEAFSASLTAMLEKLETLETDNPDVELPQIPLSEDLVLEEEDRVEKTIIEHITDSITRLQDKVAADKSKSKKTYFQADCASLQNSINKILAYQYVGGETRFMLTEEQRGLYNDVGTELTNILNNTQKQPKKDLEVINSVKTVRAEIHRLIAFHNNIREQLTAFQKELRTIDQGTFYNDIEKFVTKGPLDAKQTELVDLLESIKDCQDDEFNVLSPTAGTWQEKVVSAVRQLTDSGTELVDTLQDVLLNQQIQGASADEEPIPREYKKVTPKKDATYAQKFQPMMENIRDFADTLHAGEASRLATFFEANEVGMKSAHSLGMFGDTAPHSGGHDWDLDSDHSSGFGRSSK